MDTKTKTKLLRECDIIKNRVNCVHSNSDHEEAKEVVSDLVHLMKKLIESSSSCEENPRNKIDVSDSSDDDVINKVLEIDAELFEHDCRIDKLELELGVKKKREAEIPKKVESKKPKLHVEMEDIKFELHKKIRAHKSRLGRMEEKLKKIEIKMGTI